MCLNCNVEENEAEDLCSAKYVIAWWKDQECCLPNWARACKYMTLIQLTSVAAKRVLSLLLMLGHSPLRIFPWLTQIGL